MPRAAEKQCEEANYWEAVGIEWTHRKKDALWRRHSDFVNRSLFARWLGSATYDRILKTDLFDEAMTTGGLLPIVLRSSNRVVGMDISSSIVSIAERRLEIAALCADVRRLPFPDQSFDVILSNSTLDHFEKFVDLVRALTELRRVLRKSGELWLTLDNLSNPLVAIRNRLPFRFLRSMGLVPYYVGASCGHARFKRVLDETGFDVSEDGAVLHCPRALSVRLTRFAERYGSPDLQRRVLRFLAKFERAGNWPTKFCTGYFLCARAVKR
jgi:SAM-dependent methyltransferase